MLQPIVENSVKFRARGITTIFGFRRFTMGDGLVIAIKDNGTGLTREYADKINFVLQQNGNLRESITVSGRE